MGGGGLTPALLQYSTRGHGDRLEGGGEDLRTDYEFRLRTVHCIFDFKKSRINSNINLYCSNCWTIIGLAALMVTTVSQGEGTWLRKEDLLISCSIL